MLTPLLVLQIVTLLAVIYLVARKRPAAEQDPRLTQLPDQLTRLDAQVRVRLCRDARRAEDRRLGPSN